jgi:hypothetical protein
MNGTSGGEQYWTGNYSFATSSVDSADFYSTYIRSSVSTGVIAFGTSAAVNTAPTERARIDSSGNLLVGTTVSPTTTLTSGSLTASGAGIYPYVMSGTNATNTGTYSGINYFNSSPLAIGNGAATTAIIGINSVPQISNTGADGTAFNSVTGITSSPVIASTGTSGRIQSVGIQALGVRASTSDLSAASNNILTGGLFAVRHNSTLPSTAVTGTATVVSANAVNLSGDMTTMMGFASAVNVANFTTSLAATSTSASAFRNSIFTVGAASGGPGTVTDAYGLNIIGPTVGATGTITNYYAAYFGAASVTGTLTNRYGVYQDDAAATNYFAGNVGVGTTSGTSKVTAAGVIESTTGGFKFPDGTTQTTSSVGTVTSVAGTGTVNGITLTGTVTSSGSLTLGGTLTGVNLTSQVTGTLPIANGGTGATSAAAALTSLGAYPASNPNGYTSNTGTVTSVGGTGTVSGLSLSGTVTTSGNLTLGGTLAVTPSNFASQTANTVLAAPNGTAGVPTFRTIVAADVPTLNQNTTGSAGSAANITGGNQTGSYEVTSGQSTRFGSANQTDGNDGKIGAGLFGSGLNIVGTQTSAGTGRQIRLYGALIDSGGIEYVRNTGSWGISVTGTAANVTGTVAIANGGTGSTTAANALTALGAYPATNPNGYTSNTGTVTGVTGTSPIVSSGGTAPAISISAATTSAAGSMSAADKTKLDGIAANANNYVLPKATATTLGGVEVFSATVQTVAANAVTTTASRTYGVQLNSVDQMVVNVPWTDTNSGGTVTSVGGTGTVSGLTLSGTVTTSGNLTLGGTLTLTSGQVTTALGYTPYNSTNPSGYISANQTITLSGDVTGSGTTAITTTLANSGVTAGTYNSVTVNAKGIVTAATVKQAPNVQSITSSSTVTPNADTNDLVSINAVAGAFTVAAPTGTSSDGEKLIIRIKDNGSSVGITWNGVYVAGGATMPTATVAGKWHHVGFIYNVNTTTWLCVAATVQA